MAAKVPTTQPPTHPPYKLIGKNYTTPDLVAKVTGQAKYAEDYRADGMLFCKLLLSPMPHARVRSIDASAALAMPGVKAILTVDDLPAPADSHDRQRHSDPGQPAGRARPHQRAGVPGRADSRRGRGRRTHRRRSHRENSASISSGCRSSSIRWSACGPAGRTRESKATSGCVPPPRAGPARAVPPEVAEAQVDRSGLRRGQRRPTADGQGAPTEWQYGDVEAGFKNAALVLDETFVTPNTSHQRLETRTAMAYWQNGKVYVHTGTQSTAQTAPGDRALAEHRRPSKVVVISEYTGGGFGSKITGAISLIIPALLSKKANAPVMMRISREEETLHRPRASQPARPHESRLHQGRPDHRARHVRRLRQRPVRSSRAMPHRRAASSRCCTSRRRCAGAE